MMKQIGMIQGDEDSYMCCSDCGKINWYENKTCVNCGIKKNNWWYILSRREAERLLEDCDEDGMDQYTEIEV